MTEKWKPKLNKSLSENAASLLSFLYDQLMSHAVLLIGHPRMIDRLHTMRIDGKPLRYMMEIFDPIFGQQYRKCFEAVKYLLELLGKTHDCDVTKPILQSHLREVRLFNKSSSAVREKLSTRGIRELIRQQQEQREALFTEMCRILQRWKRENFRGKLLRSMRSWDFLSLLRPH